MAIFDLDKIKRILMGQDDEDLGQATGQMPIPQQRPIDAITQGPTTTVKDVLAQQAQEKPYEATGLLSLLPKSMQPESKESQQAVARALMMGGFAGLANPGQTWQESLGTIGLGAMQGYDNAMGDSRALSAQRDKQQQEQEQKAIRERMAQSMMAMGNTQSAKRQQLASLAADAARLGEMATLNQVQAQMQELDKKMASEMMQWDEETQQYVPAPGAEQGVADIARSKKAGEQQGTEQFVRTEDQREVDRVNEQRKAAGLDPISDEDWIRTSQQKTGTKIVDANGNEYPAPDKGYRYVKADDGSLKLEMIPGGEADMKSKEAQTKKAGNENTKQFAATNVTRAIDKILTLDKSASLPTTGFFGSYIKGIEGTSAYDISKNLDTIKANLGFDKLQEMRNNSPTGGALGSVTAPEMELLQSAITSLDQSQSDAEFKENLNYLYNTYMDVIHGKDAAQKLYRPLDYGTEEYFKKEAAKKEVAKQNDKPADKSQRGKGTAAEPLQIQSEDEIDDLPDGTVVILNGQRFTVQGD